MSSKKKLKSSAIIEMKSSEKLLHFLNENHLHKKDFAEMIGVTLSYVYNLIDNTIPFSTRTTTLERIACVMDVEPEYFEEYKLPQEPIVRNEEVDFIIDKRMEKGLTTVQFLKAFPRKKRVEMVDILRGAMPIPLDWKELCLIAQVLGITKEDIYPVWEARFKQVLSNAGFNIMPNSALMTSILKCAREYVHN